MPLLTVLEILLYVVTSFIFTGLAFERRAVLFAVFGTVVPMWEMGQLASSWGSGSPDVILTTTYDPNLAAYVDYLVNGLDFMLLLAIATILAAVVAIDMATSKGLENG